MSRFNLLASVSLLTLAVGCVSVKTPDVSVDVMDPVNAYKRTESSSKEVEPAKRLRYTPYANTLERVNRQQVRVNEKFNKRDWEDLEEEAGDWIADIRALNGYASTSHDPEKFRTLASQLLEAVQDLKSAAGARNADRCRGDLESADRILNQFSKAFPLTEPADAPPSEPRPSRTTKAP